MKLSEEQHRAVVEQCLKEHTELVQATIRASGDREDYKIIQDIYFRRKNNENKHTTNRN